MEELRIIEVQDKRVQDKSVCTTCQRCWLKVQDILDWEVCNDTQCDKSIIFQAELISLSQIDPLEWILQYAEKFRDLWSKWFSEDEIKQKIYN